MCTRACDNNNWNICSCHTLSRVQYILCAFCKHLKTPSQEELRFVIRTCGLPSDARKVGDWDLHIQEPLPGVWDQVRRLEFDPRNGVDFWQPDKDGKPVDEPKLLGTFDFVAVNQKGHARLMCLFRNKDDTTTYLDRSPRGPAVGGAHPPHEVKPPIHKITAEEKAHAPL